MEIIELFGERDTSRERERRKTLSERERERRLAKEDLKFKWLMFY